MKNLKKHILLVFLAAFTLAACEDQSDSIFGDGELGANLITPTTGALIRGETPSITFDIELENNEGITVNQVLVYGQLNATVQVNDSTTAGESSDKVLLETRTSDGTVSFPIEELFSDLPVDGEVRSEDDLFPGDTFVFSYELVLADGRTLTIARSYVVTFTCPSDLGGKYLNTTEVSVSDFGAQSYEYEVELVDLGDGRYQIEDMTGGLWSTTYADEYGTTARETVLVEVCGQVTVQDAPDLYGGFITTDGRPAPTYDPETGVITWSWVDTIYGETGVTTYTPVAE